MSKLLNAYTALGLEPGSPKDSVNARYKQLVMVWHPDRFPTSEGKTKAEEELKKILTAKELLLKHFDSGKHKESGCECGGSGAAASTSTAAAKAPAAKKDSGLAPNQPAAAAAAKTKGTVPPSAAAPDDPNAPSSEQRKRWAKLEKALEREEKQDELRQQKELLEQYFKDQGKGASTPARPPAKPKKKGKTIQDLLESGGDIRDSEPWKDKVIELYTSLLEEWKYVVLAPVDFFNSMSIDDGFKDPLIFVAAIAAINFVGFCFYDPMHVLNALWIGLQGALAIIACSFIQAGVTMAVSKGLGGTGSYQATYRACAYSYGPIILAWIPLINILACLYSLFMLKIGLERCQELSSTRSSAVVGILVVLAIVAAAIFMVLGVGHVVRGSTE